MPRLPRHIFVSLLVTVSVISGCAAPPRQPAPGEGASASSATITNTDPCAMRLHEISGQLLLAVAQSGTLPEDLSSLEIDQPAVCPVSHRAYVYRPAGIWMAERGVRVVLYDPTPAHAGMRWAVTIDEPREGAPLVTKVIALPERFFLLHPPEATE